MKQSNNSLRCYTIGYSDLPRAVFLYFIKKEQIDTLVDVRTTPYSSYQPNYNKKELKTFLESNDIQYQYCGDRLGGYHTEPDLLFGDGTVNYENVRKRPAFQQAIDDLIDLIKQSRTVCLMCAEKKPQQCHRFILISRELQARGIQVIHIVPSIDLIPNEQLEEELFNEMFDPGQSNLLHQPKRNVEELYQKLNRILAYRTDTKQNSGLTNAKTEIIGFSQSSAPFNESGFPSSDKKTISGKNKHMRKGITDDTQDTLF
jgi:hypothetical protein